MPLSNRANTVLVILICLVPHTRIVAADAPSGETQLPSDDAIVVAANQITKMEEEYRAIVESIEVALQQTMKLRAAVNVVQQAVRDVKAAEAAMEAAKATAIQATRQSRADRLQPKTNEAGAVADAGDGDEPGEDVPDPIAAFASAAAKLEIERLAFPEDLDELKNVHTEYKRLHSEIKSLEDSFKELNEAFAPLFDVSASASVTPSDDGERPAAPENADTPTFVSHQDDSQRSPAGSGLQVVDAFSHLPLVRTMQAADDLGDFSKHPADERGESRPLDSIAYDYRFDAPAHFPLPAFGIRGEESSRDGAIIYEGMRFAVREDGRYQVRFVVGTPAIPVTMCLQLIVEDEGTQNHYTLTLPPISIPEPDKPQHLSQQRKVQQVHGNVQTVHHEGYLPVLTQPLSNIRVVRRTGSARFGFGVDVP